MQIKVSGLKEVEAELQKLGSKEGTRVLRSAMLRATKPIEDQAKANAAAWEKGSGSIEKAIGRRFVVGKSDGPRIFGIELPSLGGVFTVVITPILKSRVAIALHNLYYHRKRRGIFHGHFLEFKGRPFLKPALDARGAQAVSALAGEIKAGIERLLERRQS